MRKQEADRLVDLQHLRGIRPLRRKLVVDIRDRVPPRRERLAIVAEIRLVVADIVEWEMPREELLRRRRDCLPRAVAARMLCDWGALTQRQSYNFV